MFCVTRDAVVDFSKKQVMLLLTDPRYSCVRHTWFALHNLVHVRSLCRYHPTLLKQRPGQSTGAFLQFLHDVYIQC
jgi:hypothetical protein